MYNHNMKFGKIEIEGKVFVAPMAGITDRAFREIITKYIKPDIIYTEMVSSKAILYNDQKTLNMMKSFDGEKIRALQIFGGDVESMRYAAKKINDENLADILDINMGCPVPKVARAGAGAELLKDIDLAREIVRNVREVFTKTLTVKIRTGLSMPDKCIDYVKMFNEEKVDLITIHGRTKKEGFSGEINYDIVNKAKQISKVPIIVNGNIMNAKIAIETLNKTNADGIMLARAVFQNFEECIDIVAKVNNINLEDIQKNIKIKDIVEEHFKLMVKYQGETVAIRNFRKNIIWYSEKQKNKIKIRQNVINLKDEKSFYEILELFDN